MVVLVKPFRDGAFKMKMNRYFQLLAKLICISLFIGSCISVEKRYNTTSVKDQERIGNTMERSDNTTSVKEERIGNTTGRSDNTTSVKDQERIGNTTERSDNTTSVKDEERIGNTTGRSDNTTSVKDEERIDNTTERRDNTTSIKHEERIGNTTSVKDEECIDNATNRSVNVTSVKGKNCTGNTTNRSDDTTSVNDKELSVHDSKEWIENSTKIFEKLMTNYDPSMAPFVPGKPVNVSFIFEVLAFGEVDEANMEYALDLVVIQVWHDIRLDQGQDRRFSFSGNDIKRIWTPDTYFMNAKQSEIKNVMKDNQMVLIVESGHVVQMSRVALKVACHMQLQMYPFDRQECDLVIESFSLTEDKLVYHWGNLLAEECVVQIFDDAMAQYEYKGVKLNYNHEKISSAGFSNMFATFVFDRRTSYTVLQVYLPSYMIVFLSFMALWLPQDAVPARVALGITTVLTIVYFLGTVNSGMPRVSYMKAIDCHLFVSFGFVFATMFEYVVLLNVKDRKKRKPIHHDNNMCELGPLNNHASEESSQSNNHGADVVVRYRIIGNDQNHSENEPLTVFPLVPLHSIDRLSRILFPASYGAFIIVYWVVCAALSPQRNELDRLC